MSNRAHRRSIAAHTRKQAALRPKSLTVIPREEWPPARDAGRVRVMISREFLVQIFLEKDAIRLSACRTTTKEDAGWEDGITWDELQRVKAEAGYGNQWAVEIFPPDDQVVNVSNMRHLWVVDRAPEFAWQIPSFGGESVS